MPDLVVEVQSPTDRYCQIVAKATRYLDAGVQQVWIVRPVLRIVEVLTPEEMIILREGDVLMGGTVLAGFQMAVATLFAGME